MSLPFYAFPEIFDNRLWRKLSPSAKALYPAILKHANLATGIAFPGTDLLMELSGIKTEATLIKAIKELKSVGVLNYWLVPIKGGGFKKKRVFKVNMAHIEQFLRPTADKPASDVYGAGKPQPAISAINEPQPEREEPSQREPSVNKRTEIGSYSILLSQIEALIMEYGQETFDEAANALKKRNDVKYPIHYLRSVCERIQSRKDEENLEKRNKEEKIRFSQEAKEVSQNPDFQKLLGGLLKTGKGLTG